MSKEEAYAPLLDKGVALRIRAKVFEDEAAALKNEANALFKAAIDISGEPKLDHDQGTVREKTTTRSTLNKEKLATVLVDKGVQASVVADSIAEATDTKTSTSIEFRMKR